MEEVGRQLREADEDAGIDTRLHELWVEPEGDRITQRQVVVGPVVAFGRGDSGRARQHTDDAQDQQPDDERPKSAHLNSLPPAPRRATALS